MQRRILVYTQKIFLVFVFYVTPINLLLFFSYQLLLSFVVVFRKKKWNEMKVNESFGQQQEDEWQRMRREFLIRLLKALCGVFLWALWTLWIHMDKILPKSLKIGIYNKDIGENRYFTFSILLIQPLLKNDNLIQSLVFFFVFFFLIFNILDRNKVTGKKNAWWKFLIGLYSKTKQNQKISFFIVQYFSWCKHCTGGSLRFYSQSHSSFLKSSIVLRDE